MLPGCMTIRSQHVFWKGTEPEAHSPYHPFWVCEPDVVVFGGIANNIRQAARRRADLGHICHAIDLPLCLAADVLLLPLTVGQQIAIKSRESESDGACDDRSP